MSQRRNTSTSGRSDHHPHHKAELVPVQEPLALDQGVAPSLTTTTTNHPSASPTTTTTSPLSIDDRYETERQNSKRQHWKDSPFAVGLVAPTWEEEGNDDSETICYCINPSSCQDDDIDSSGCMCCSGWVCGRLGAGRVGNMAVLSQSIEWVEQVEQDEETGEELVHKVQRPRLHYVVGPYWPMLICITYPLILGVSLLTLWKGVPGKHPALVFFWALCTGGLIYALFKTSFSDPGILYRHASPPPQDENSWRWSDQAQSYRPRGAFYDSDCAVVVEDFDHTCPWTGTAIGKGNMPYFQMFVSLVFFCLIFDILLLTKAL